MNFTSLAGLVAAGAVLCGCIKIDVRQSEEAAEPQDATSRWIPRPAIRGGRHGAGSEPGTCDSSVRDRRRYVERARDLRHRRGRKPPIPAHVRERKDLQHGRPPQLHRRRRLQHLFGLRTRIAGSDGTLPAGERLPLTRGSDSQRAQYARAIRHPASATSAGTLSRAF